jgi:hypothetical protein
MSFNFASAGDAITYCLSYFSTVSQQGLRVWAIEPNAEMQAVATPHPHIEFTAGTAEHIPLETRRSLLQPDGSGSNPPFSLGYAAS